jgi:predicted peroxiredoxin
MCDRCSKARDLKYTNTIEGIGIPGTYEFVNLLKESDKVLSFGG